MMDAVFKLVLTTSLYAGIVGIVILLFKTILKNKINPRWHYLIWIVLMLKLIVPFGPESAVSLFNTIPEIPQQTNFTQMYEEYRQTYDSVRQSGDKTHIPSAWTLRNSVLHFAAAAEKAIPFIWFAGTALMLGWLLLTHFSLTGRIKKSAIPVPESINLILENCSKKTRLKKGVPAVIQDIISTPSLFDLFRPKILMPPSVLKLSDKEVSYILLHELAHYKRKDLIVNHLLLLLQSIHWFNPVIWFCFNKIRQDMELAADERALALLEPREHKEYGKVLLCAIENLNRPKFAPRLIGMVDDRKNIERRIKMIKMADFFRNRRRTVLIIGVLCISVLSGLLLTNGLTKSNSITVNKESGIQSNEYDATRLVKYKSPYVGDNSNVVNLLGSLPFADMRGKVSLQTKSKPYGITVKYDFSRSGLSIDAIDASLRKNATVVFSLIDNVDKINFDYISAKGNGSCRFTREQLQSSFDKDIREYARDADTFKILLNSLLLSFEIFPEKYTPAMSSTPGIRISAHYAGDADKVEYSATSGKLLTWDSINGKISELGQKVRLPLGTPVYWSPSAEGTKGTEEIAVKAAVLNKNAVTAEKQVKIKYDNSTYFYSVIPSNDVYITDIAKVQSQSPRSVEEAVSLAIKAQGKGYNNGEVVTEGHIILEVEEKANIIKAYTISSIGWFGFENGIFTVVSGSGNIPTVITFSKNQNGEYLLVEYKKPVDGSGNLRSIKKMFPEKLWDKVLNKNKYPELIKQKEDQAREYLKSIGRNARVSAASAEKKLPVINVEASNKIFAGYTKYDEELNKFPYWIGTKELLEDGIRYIYETSQGKTGDDYDLISFRKSKEDGTVVKELQYKIIGEEVYPLQ